MKVLAVIGWSGSGKTTLIESIMPLLQSAGLKIAVIKQSHHALWLDVIGKDSARHYQAGADQVLLVHKAGMAYFAKSSCQLDLTAQLQLLAPCDLVLLEGHKNSDCAKVEMVNSDLKQPLLANQDPQVMALIGDVALDSALPTFNRNDLLSIVNFILGWYQGGNRDD